MQFLFGFLLSAISLFLILIILVQRGRGGGLTGALGGMGGQSAFGTKAGDTFTRITVGVATGWILIAILAVKLLGGRGAGGPLGDASAVAPEVPAATAPAAGDATDILDNLPPADAGAATGGTSDAGAAGDAASAEAEPSGE